MNVRGAKIKWIECGIQKVGNQLKNKKYITIIGMYAHLAAAYSIIILQRLQNEKHFNTANSYTFSLRPTAS